MSLVIVTGNPDKAREYREILGEDLEIVSLELLEIQGSSAEEIVRAKAEAAYAQLQRAAVVDDVSLEVEVWNGFPGPYIKWVDKKLGRGSVITMNPQLAGERVVAAVLLGYCDENGCEVIRGEAKGTLASEERGTNGWGFDFIFIPDGYDKTWAELGPNVKNQNSHRKVAITKLREFLATRKS